MNKIDKAIIVAAGKGERMQPLTLKTPKPLVKVNGLPMIESVINALHKNNINEIYVVVGYLKEQFYYLEEKYDGLKLIENPLYDKCNNISSLYFAREYLENTFILDGDQIIYNTDILNPEYDFSGYNAVYTDKQTNEWLMTLDENGFVSSCSKDGGSCGWQLFSVSRWSSKDGKMLRNLLETEFEVNKNIDIYWDNIAMFCYPEKFNLKVYEMNYGDIIEIDNVKELKAVDKSYINM